jgi:hypothetical protein
MPDKVLHFNSLFCLGANMFSSSYVEDGINGTQNIFFSSFFYFQKHCAYSDWNLVPK